MSRLSTLADSGGLKGGYGLRARNFANPKGPCTQEEIVKKSQKNI